MTTTEYQREIILIRRFAQLMEIRLYSFITEIRLTLTYRFIHSVSIHLVIFVVALAAFI